MEDAAVEDAEVNGAAEFAPDLVTAHSIAFAVPPPSPRLDESCPPVESTAEEMEMEEAVAAAVARSSSSSGKAPMPEVPPEDPAPAPTQAAARKKKKTKKKVTMPQSHLVAEWFLQPLDEEWLKSMTARTPNGPEIQKQQQWEKGCVEMEISDEEDQEDGRRAPYRYGRGRWRFRPGVCKKLSGEIRKIFY